ncbi:leucine-rich repeat protein, putative [Bodo saltans]|uniref:Leucine-rich repeat protein, putative n=1 Tax=Bodo saltans TaxID=75058 RepID=A0A0S4J1K5_BODSA|nr:leucine-rich repeat protein, putative [Bodo saltans]|eukprot:CUG52725.1 leucine-rich repeat protein, putative [Bodo saltans]
MSSPTERAPTTSPQYIVASDCAVLGAPLPAGGVDNLNMCDGVLTASGQPNRPAAVKRLVGLKAADVAWLNGGTVDSSSLSILGIHRKFTKRVTTTTHLRHMDLSCCRSIGDLGLSGIATMTQLKHLDLSYCNITDAAEAQ